MNAESATMLKRKSDDEDCSVKKAKLSDDAWRSALQEGDDVVYVERSGVHRAATVVAMDVEDRDGPSVLLRFVDNGRERDTHLSRLQPLTPTEGSAPHIEREIVSALPEAASCTPLLTVGPAVTSPIMTYLPEAVAYAYPAQHQQRQQQQQQQQHQYRELSQQREHQQEQQQNAGWRPAALCMASAPPFVQPTAPPTEILQNLDSAMAHRAAAISAGTDWHVKSLIVNTLLIFSSLSILVTGEGFVVWALLGCWYMRIVTMSDAAAYMYYSEITDTVTATDKLAALRIVKPLITTFIQSYHYKAEVNKVELTDGKVIYTPSLQRINTFSVTEDFNFKHWEDVSESEYHFLTRQRAIIRLSVHSQVRYGDTASKDAYDLQSLRMRQRYRNLDVEQDCADRYTIAGAPVKMVVLPASGFEKKKLWWVSRDYYILSVFTLTHWCYQRALEAYSVRLEYELKKPVYVQQPVPS
jgi:hypothetical protein